MWIVSAKILMDLSNAVEIPTVGSLRRRDCMIDASCQLVIFFPVAFFVIIRVAKPLGGGALFNRVRAGTG